MLGRMAQTWTVRATVLRVIDGDTFAADLDLGFGVWRREIAGAPSRIRLLGYDAPEAGDPGFEEATAALVEAIPAGSIVWIISRRLDSFGRCLADVELLDGRDLLDLLPADYRLGG